MAEQINHNKNDFGSYNDLMSRIRQNQVKTKEDLIKNRILQNLDYWENSMTKVKGIDIPSEYVNNIIEETPIRRAYLSENSNYNKFNAYKIAKSLIKSGVAPSSVCITSLNECYLSIRGFGELADKKREIFSDKNEILIIDGVREDRPTDIKDNSKAFMQELLSYMQNNEDLNVIFVGDSMKCKDLANSASETTAYFKRLNLNIDFGKKEVDTVVPIKKKKRFIKW